MYRIYHTGLPKEQLKKIKNREYTHDEIEYYINGFIVIIRQSKEHGS